MSICQDIFQSTIELICQKSNIKLEQKVLNEFSLQMEAILKETLKSAKVLYNKANTRYFSVEHVNEILLSRHMPPLYGYTNNTPYVLSDFIPSGNDKLRYVIDNLSSIEDEMSKDITPKGYTISTSINWNQIIDIPLYRSKPLLHPKNTFKVPDAMLITMNNQNYKIDDYSKKYGSIKDLPQELLDFYKNFVLYYDDHENNQSFTEILEQLKTFSGYEYVLPLFLEHFYFSLTTSLSNSAIVIRCAQAALAIASNPSLPIVFFAHPLLKIAMTIVLKDTIDENIEKDIQVREAGAELTAMVTERSLNGYGHLQTVIYNKMARKIFSIRPLCEHIGAFLVIAKMKMDVLSQFGKNHILAYINMLKIHEDKTLVKILIRILLTEFPSINTKNFQDIKSMLEDLSNNLE